MTTTHAISQRPAVPSDGTNVPGSIALECPCGWRTVAIDDPAASAKEYGDRHLADPDRKTYYYEVTIR